MSSTAHESATPDERLAFPEGRRSHALPANQAGTAQELRVRHAARVPHSWIVGPRDATRAVMPRAEAGCTTAPPAERGETARPEPLDDPALVVGTRPCAPSRSWQPRRWDPS